MTTTETETVQQVISESVSGPYMTLTIEPGVQLVLGRTRFPSTSWDLMVITIVDEKVASTNAIPRFEAIRAIEILKTLL